MRRVIFLLFTVLLITTGTAAAESIAGRLGVTGKLGATIPLNDEFIDGTSDTNAGFSGGGGLIYGLNDQLAIDLEVFHMPELEVEVDGVKTYEAEVTDIALGVQFRFPTNGSLVPYLGIGADFIRGNLDYVSGNSYDLDWTYGGHVNAGVDWFITPGIAFTADIRGVYAADGDISSDSSDVSEYSPQWVQGTVGVRLMLPESL